MKIKQTLGLIKFKLSSILKEKFVCPICTYEGPFKSVQPPTGLRKHAQCPHCGSLERHRLQFLVMKQLLKDLIPHKLKMLHFAPENFFKPIFTAQFGQYETADLHLKNTDHKVDIQHLPFPDSSFDLVYASHVLEHIPDDYQALSEIYRILSPNGFAILPVPIVAEKTIEYPAPNPHEAGHVRAPGVDYFDRYRKFFSKIELYSSECFSSQYQLFNYENRFHWPTPKCPLRPPMEGEKHLDFVPVCYT